MADAGYPAYSTWAGEDLAATWLEDAGVYWTITVR